MTTWTREPDPRRPKVQWLGPPFLWTWRCDQHERQHVGFRTAADANDSAARHVARRH